MSSFAWIRLQDVAPGDLPAYGKPVLVACEVEMASRCARTPIRRGSIGI